MSPCRLVLSRLPLTTPAVTLMERLIMELESLTTVPRCLELMVLRVPVTTLVVLCRVPVSMRECLLLVLPPVPVTTVLVLWRVLMSPLLQFPVRLVVLRPDPVVVLRLLRTPRRCPLTTRRIRGYISPVRMT